MFKKPNHKTPGIPASPYRPLDEGGVRQIADAALEVLAKSGMAVYSTRRSRHFGRPGRRSTPKHASCDCPARWSKTPSTPTRRRSRSFLATASMMSSWRETASTTATGGTAIYVLDPDTGERRPSTVGGRDPQRPDGRCPGAHPRVHDQRVSQRDRGEGPHRRQPLLPRLGQHDQARDGRDLLAEGLPGGGPHGRR